MPSEVTMLPSLLTVEYHLPNEPFPFHVNVTEMQVFRVFDRLKPSATGLDMLPGSRCGFCG